MFHQFVNGEKEDSVKWYFEVLRKYAVFSGRARRREYWMFFLFNILIAIALGIIEGAFSFDSEDSRSTFGTLYGLAILIPSLAVGVRRLHDTARSGWWMLICLIPIIGAIVLLVFMVQDSQSTDNQYGPNPKREMPLHEDYSVNQP
jgi:uncharacterized membrane protein YhaH (DUF805 family)